MHGPTVLLKEKLSPGAILPPYGSAAAAGADGLIIEVHNNPAAALCDGAQSLTPAEFEETAKLVNAVRGAVGTVAGY